MAHVRFNTLLPKYNPVGRVQAEMLVPGQKVCVSSIQPCCLTICLQSRRAMSFTTRIPKNRPAQSAASDTRSPHLHTNHLPCASEPLTGHMLDVPLCCACSCDHERAPSKTLGPPDRCIQKTSLQRYGTAINIACLSNPRLSINMLHATCMHCAKYHGTS